MAAVLGRMELRRVTVPFTGEVQELYTDNILYVESRKNKPPFFKSDEPLQIVLDIIPDKR